MARQKKIKSLHSEENTEVYMTQDQAVDTVKELDAIQSEIDQARIELENTKREIEEKKHEVKRISSREVDEDEMVIIKKQVNMSTEKKALKEKIEKQKAFDNQKVTGKFINRRHPGKVSEKLLYQKYEDDPVKWYDFQDGGVYTIPRGFADQINEHYYTPIFNQKQGEQRLSSNLGDNSAISDVDTSKKKYSFVPVGF